jgi:membrane fusion protein, heavy metal efflux system
VAVLSSPELAGLQVDAIAKQSEADGNAMSAIANLQLAEQNLNRQKSLVEVDIQQAQTELNLDKERYDRDRELFTQGAITKRQVQESESKYVAAKSALAKAFSHLPMKTIRMAIAEFRSPNPIAKRYNLTVHPNR